MRLSEESHRLRSSGRTRRECCRKDAVARDIQPNLRARRLDLILGLPRLDRLAAQGATPTALAGTADRLHITASGEHPDYEFVEVLFIARFASALRGLLHEQAVAGRVKPQLEDTGTDPELPVAHVDLVAARHAFRASTGANLGLAVGAGGECPKQSPNALLVVEVAGAADRPDAMSAIREELHRALPFTVLLLHGAILETRCQNQFAYGMPDGNVRNPAQFAGGGDEEPGCQARRLTPRRALCPTRSGPLPTRPHGAIVSGHMISRRSFVAGSVALLAAPLAVKAQPAKLPVVGVLNSGAGPR